MRSDFRDVLTAPGPRSILDVRLPADLRLLVVGPHPDDFDAIGATLRHFCRQGHTLDVIVARTGSGVDASYRPGAGRDERADLREREQRASALFFGLAAERLTFLSLAADADDQPIVNQVNLSEIEACVSARNPDVVLMPHGNDTNSGHRAMHALVRRVAQRLGGPQVVFLNRDPKTVAMRTDLYLPFGPEEARWKAELLRFHDTQQQRNLRARGRGFDERILECNRQTAREIGLDAPYAEAFEVEFAL